jgi:hypothetical protein
MHQFAHGIWDKTDTGNIEATDADDCLHDDEWRSSAFSYGLLLA